MGKASRRERSIQEPRQRAPGRAPASDPVDTIRKLQSLLELGRLFGLDLRLGEILRQIAQKAAQVMGADLCSVFLFDPKTDELCLTVSLDLGEGLVRMPSGAGVAGHCFTSGAVVNLEDAYTDPRFNRDVDRRTGYRTRSMLCMPLYTREREKLGVIQLLNKKDGVFTPDDETFLRTFGNHAAIFIEMAQLQQARIDALEQSRVELERLNKAKDKALDHLSHELRTPLAVMQGNLKVLKRKLQAQHPSFDVGRHFDIVEGHLRRITDIQQETDKMIRVYQEVAMEDLPLFSAATRAVERARQRAPRRDLRIQVDGLQDLTVRLDGATLEDVLDSLLKNAIENTPDEGLVRVSFERRGRSVRLRVEDFGIGITAANLAFIFDGLFHTQETDLYTSKRPYDFYAGGKGLDLRRMKLYGQRFNFDVSVDSRRCVHIPADGDLCPGRVSACEHCGRPEDCLASGGSAFTLTFPMHETPAGESPS
jgi:signal transduction histidine kinase